VDFDEPVVVDDDLPALLLADEQPVAASAVSATRR
jgi:hypothetical protein